MKATTSFLAIILLILVLLDSAPLKAGLFNGKGKLKAYLTYDDSLLGGWDVAYDCNYSFKSECDRHSN